MKKNSITKKDKRRVLIWSLLIIIIISYLGVFSFHYWSQILSNKQEKTNLLESEENLKEEITKLQDPDYVAKYAREKYSLSKDGEIIIKVPEEHIEN